MTAYEGRRIFHTAGQLSPASLHEGVHDLAARDRDLAQVIRRYGPPPSGPDPQASPRWSASFLSSRSPSRPPRPRMADSRGSLAGSPLGLSQPLPKARCEKPVSPDKRQPTVTIWRELLLAVHSTSLASPISMIRQSAPSCCSFPASVLGRQTSICSWRFAAPIFGRRVIWHWPEPHNRSSSCVASPTLNNSHT